MEETKSCCPPKKGLSKGILYGILPHSFCIAFIVFSVIGATAATTIFKSLLLLPYFFQILIGISFLFATLSAIFYLKKKNSLSAEGIRDNSKYLGILFGTTVAVNLLFFLVVFPLLSKIKTVMNINAGGSLEKITLSAKIPCSGHAPLVVDELGKEKGISGVKFEFPANFTVTYNPKETTPEEILSAEIFKTFKAQLIL